MPLPASDGREVSLGDLESRIVLFVLPGIGGPDDGRFLDAWKAIPGAYGCTDEACSVRDQREAFTTLGVEVFGLSAQRLPRLRQASEELSLHYPLLSDEALRLADQLGLATFEFRGARYFERLTLVIDHGVIEAALYPVVPSERAAIQALDWLAHHPTRE